MHSQGLNCFAENKVPHFAVRRLGRCIGRGWGTKMADKSQESDSELQSSDSQDDPDELRRTIRNLGLSKGGTFVQSLCGKGLVTQLKLTAENVIIINND